MTDIIVWVSFALQVWSVYWPPYIGRGRRQYWRTSMTHWDLGFYKRTTFEREQSDIRY